MVPFTNITPQSCLMLDSMRLILSFQQPCEVNDLFPFSRYGCQDLEAERCVQIHAVGGWDSNLGLFDSRSLPFPVRCFTLWV